MQANAKGDKVKIRVEGDDDPNIVATEFLEVLEFFGLKVKQTKSGAVREWEVEKELTRN